MYILSSAVILLALGSMSAPAGGGLTWDRVYEDALARAQIEDRVIFVAVNMDGERANDRMADVVYENSLIRRLSESTVNLVASAATHSKSGKTCRRFGELTCEEHRRVDISVREKVLEPSEEGYVVAPQHVFLDPAGEVLLSVPYEITVPELEWCFVTALTAFDPSASVKMSSSARPPRRLIMGDVLNMSNSTEQPPTREEALELIEEVRRGLLGGGERRRALQRIMMADEREAIEFITAELRRGTGRGRGGGGGGGRGGGAGGLGGGGLGGSQENQRDPNERLAQTLRQIGTISPPSYWEVVAEYATSSSTRVRSEVPVALEQLGAPAALKVIRTARRKEKDSDIAKNWLRALASCGPADSKVRKTLLKQAGLKEKGAKEDLLRTNAIVSLGLLTRSDEVDERLVELLEDEQGADRSAAALAMGITRNVEWKETLEAVLTQQEQAQEDEQDEELLGTCRAAVQALEDGDLGSLRRSLRGIAGDGIDRERFFSRRARERRPPEGE